jgi:hypothetical protein
MGAELFPSAQIEAYATGIAEMHPKKVFALNKGFFPKILIAGICRLKKIQSFRTV